MWEDQYSGRLLLLCFRYIHIYIIHTVSVWERELTDLYWRTDRWTLSIEKLRFWKNTIYFITCYLFESKENKKENLIEIFAIGQNNFIWKQNIILFKIFGIHIPTKGRQLRIFFSRREFEVFKLWLVLNLFLKENICTILMHIC